MWITNGGAADFFTVFAKINGEQFTAFLVERDVGRVSPRGRRKEDGHQGQQHHAPSSSTTFACPWRMCSGEIGRGHIIAFNILNLGRLKLGPFAVGGAKAVLAASLSTPRSARPSARDCRVRAHSAQTGGDGDSHYRRGDDQLSCHRHHSGASRRGESMLKATEEFAAEC